MSNNRDLLRFIAFLIVKLVKAQLTASTTSVTSSRQYTEIGEWICEELQKLGPVYVKIGQLVATQGDIPFEISKALERLQDKSTMLPFIDVSDSIRFPENVVHVENEPIAGASLGIVYRGVWREADGRNVDVAIKVLRPNIKNELSANLWGFARFLRRLSHLSDGIEHFLDVVRQYRVSFWKELDYVREATNADKLAGAFGTGEVASWNLVPEVFRATDAFIIMEYVPGKRITDVAAIQRAGLHPPTVANHLLEAFLYQVLVSDIFHSDPHPGNIAITFGEEASNNTKLIWYDTGSVMECTDAWKSDLVRLSLAILKSDVTDIVVTLQEMQIIKKDKQSGKAVYKFIKMLLAENDSIQALSTMSSKDVMMSVNQIMDRDPIWRSTLKQSFVSNSQYVILGKSVVTINANCLALDPTFSLIPRATPIINKYLNSDGQGSTTNVAFREMMDLARNMMTMPGRVSMLEQQIGEIGEESSARHVYMIDLMNKLLIAQAIFYVLSHL